MKAMYSIKGKEVETKTFPFQLKSINEDEGTVTGHLSTFGNVDLQKDRVLPEAFKKTLADGYRRKQNGRKFLIPDLWMHDPDKPTGGVIEASEDSEGLLVTMQYDITVNAAGFPNNPTATMVFSGHKMGYIDELSMGYVAIQKEFDGGIRNLKEVQLIECSAVTMLFAANPEALTTGVKTMLEAKAVCGDTSLPIGARDASWDGSAAKKQIFSYAQDGDSFDVSKLKKCFLQMDGDAQEKGSWGYPFVDITDGSPVINVAGVKACAGALSGARNADAGGDTVGMKAKVATMYGRINKKYPKDPQLTPPWENSDKMNTPNIQRKDFNDLFVAAMAADCLEDWGDLINTLTCAMLQLFAIGDTPASDMAASLEQFNTAVTAWVAKGIECNLSQYISDQGYCNNSSTPYVPYALRAGSSDYGYMSRNPLQGSKAGRAISSANQSALEQHQTEMNTSLDAMSDHIGMMQQKVSDLTQLWKDTDQGEPYGNDKSHVSRHEPPQTLMGRYVQPPTSTVSDTTVAELEALFS